MLWSGVQGPACHPLTVVHRDVGEHVVEADGGHTPGGGRGAGDGAGRVLLDREHVVQSAARRWGGNYLPPPWDGPGLLTGELSE